MKERTVTVHSVGNEREPVVVIENFAPDPLRLREEAAERSFTPSDDNYPGLKAPVADTYLAMQRGLLLTLFHEVFALAGKATVLDVSFSMVTSPPPRLTRQQRLPHVDGLEPGRLALIHYLVPGGCDGTAFYRHRSSGFETVDRSRSAQYLDRLNEDLRQLGDPPLTYMVGDTPIFECIGQFDGVYNRALVYRSRLLHSGAIATAAPLPNNPRTGRLTITGFFAGE